MSMRRELLFVSLFAGFSAVACGSLLDRMKGDAGAADAGATVASGSGIENEAAITRYAADEQPAGDEVKTLRSAVVHSTYPGTDIVATLPADSTVTEVATHAGGVLVIFEQAGSKKMGWVDAAVVPPIAVAAVADAATPLVKPTVVVNKDAGAAKTVDAGAPKPTTPDAGAPKPATPDAGAPKPSTVKAVVKPAVGGKCEAGYYLFPTGGSDCRLLCNADADCGGGKCQEKGTQKKKICYR